MFWCKNNSVLFIRSDRTSLLKHSSLDIISTRLFSKTFSNNFSARPRKNDVLCVGWDVKPYSLAASSSTKRPLRHRSLSGCVVSTVRPFSRNILPHIVSFKLQTTATCGCMAAQVKVRVCGQGPLPPRLNGGPVCDESAAENSTLHKWILPIHRPFFLQSSTILLVNSVRDWKTLRFCKAHSKIGLRSRVCQRPSEMCVINVKWTELLILEVGTN